MADQYDDRDRQGKALERWQQQQKMWAKLTSNLAKKVGKSDPLATLPGSIHHYRLRQEESTLLDASVPPEVKSGHHAWEMNLRNYDINATGRAGGGFRYVQFGVPYPYPLYVPVRDGVTTDPESNTLTRVIVDKVAPRNKPVSESEYYRQRQTEYKAHIKKIFSHFLPGQEGLVVVGRPPPTINSKELSDGTTEEAFEPVVFYPPPPPQPQELGLSSTPPPNEEASHRAETARTRRSSVAPSEISVVEDRKRQPTGPALTISAASLVAHVRPGELAQLTLCAANGGSTAIFYQWAPRERDPVPGLTDKPPAAFDMADVPTGVLLPGDQKLFTFSFRPTRAGSFSQTMDLNTVPAGKERILVHLQVFAISEDENPAGTRLIDEQCFSKAIRNDLHAALLAPITGSGPGNYCTNSDAKTTLRLLDNLRKEPADKRANMMRTESALWAQNNNVSQDPLPSASCPFREAHVHQLQSAKDGRSSASLVQSSQSPQGVLPGSQIANAPLVTAPRTAKLNSVNEGLFAGEPLSLPYHAVTHQKLKDLFLNIRVFNAECAAVLGTTAPREPRPPPHPAPQFEGLAGGRPKSGGAAAAKLQHQANLLQQQLAEREVLQAPNAARGDTGARTPTRRGTEGRSDSIGANTIFSPPGAFTTYPVAAILSPSDPQMAHIAAQEGSISRAVSTFEKASPQPLPTTSEHDDHCASNPSRAHDLMPPRGTSPDRGVQAPAATITSAASPTHMNSLQPAGGRASVMMGPAASPSALRTRAVSLQWDGSVRMLMEELSQVRDNVVRNSFMSALQLLLRTAHAGGEDHTEESPGADKSTLQDLVGLLAAQEAFSEGIASLDAYANTSKVLVLGEGRMAAKRGVAEGASRDKGKDKMINAKATKAAAASKAGAVAVGVGGGNPRPPSADGRGTGFPVGGFQNDDGLCRISQMVEAFYSGAENIYENTVMRQLRQKKERYLALIASVCDQPVTVTHHRRLELLRQELISPHADVDTVAEPTKKKR